MFKLSNTHLQNLPTTTGLISSLSLKNHFTFFKTLYSPINSLLSDGIDTGFGLKQQCHAFDSMALKQSISIYIMLKAILH